MKRQGLRLDVKDTYICRACGNDYVAKLKSKDKIRCSNCLKDGGVKLSTAFIKLAKEYEKQKKEGLRG